MNSFLDSKRISATITDAVTNGLRDAEDGLGTPERRIEMHLVDLLAQKFTGALFKCQTPDEEAIVRFLMDKLGMKR